VTELPIEESKEKKEITSSEYDSEEERLREREQLQKEILDHLWKKEEPLTMQQLSYQLKTGKKFIEEALTLLLR